VDSTGAVGDSAAGGSCERTCWGSKAALIIRISCFLDLFPASARAVVALAESCGQARKRYARRAKRCPCGKANQVMGLLQGLHQPLLPYL
jgi:hypothetical protein